MSHKNKFNVGETWKMNFRKFWSNTRIGSGPISSFYSQITLYSCFIAFTVVFRWGRAIQQAKNMHSDSRQGCEAEGNCEVKKHKYRIFEGKNDKIP